MKKALAAPDFAHVIGDWHLSPVLDTGDFVFLSGVTGARPDLSVSADPETQFRDAFSFVAMNLEAAGLNLADVVEMTTYQCRPEGTSLLSAK